LTLLEELAEDIEVHLPAPPSVEKLELPDCVLIDEIGFPWAPAGASTGRASRSACRSCGQCSANAVGTSSRGG
jgi:hypothetical protein